MPASSARDPTVSVIVPVYDVEPFVGEALESLMCQSYTDFEAIVVNDGSTDGTEAAVGPFRSRVRYVKQENRALRSHRGAAASLSPAQRLPIPRRSEEARRACPNL